MSETTKILWSGLTGRTGRAALPIAAAMSDVEIVAGASRMDMDYLTTTLAAEGDVKIELLMQDVERYQYFKLNKPFAKRPRKFDVVVDFSHTNAFDEILAFAVRTGKPFISGTSGLSIRQVASLYDATNRIPVFRDDNFRFKVKKFIDEAIEFVKVRGGDFTLFESFYEGKSLPSETSKLVQRRIREAAGIEIDVRSAAIFEKNQLICDWELLRKDKTVCGRYEAEGPHCRTVGFDNLAHDVLEIAKVMRTKPIKPGELYELDEIWDDIPKSAKITI